VKFTTTKSRGQPQQNHKYDDAVWPMWPQRHGEIVGNNKYSAWLT